MKIKNTTNRNISLLSNHKSTPEGKTGGAPERLLIPAGTTMEFEDDLYSKCKKAASKLVSLGHLQILEDIKCTLSDEELIKRIEAAGVSVDSSVSREKLEKVAKKLEINME